MERGNSMSNRTMQQKALKLRRQRRAWAKSYSMPKHIVANRSVLKEYKERAKGLGLAVDTETVLRHMQVLTLPENLQEQRLFFTVLDNCWHRLECYFNSQKTCFVLCYTDKRKRIVMRSIEYGSKERALHVWHHSKVIWVETVQSGQ